MAIPTNNAFLNPRKNIKTKTTRITPKIMLFTKSSTWLLVLVERSLVILTPRLSGRYSSCSVFTISLIWSTASIIFLPARFFTSSITTGLPYSRAKVVASFSLKLIFAISFRKILPPSVFTTTFSSSLGSSISPMIRMFF